jgi:type 1 glutamine amidotransferase
MHEFTVSPRNKEHPITKGVAEFKHGRDELYQNSLVPEGSEVLMTAFSDKEKDPKNTGKHEPVVWVAEYGKGRVCQNSLGHDVEAMKSSGGYAVLLVRGVEWAATGKVTQKIPADFPDDKASKARP